MMLWFDEAFNRISNKKQNDLHLIYLDDTSQLDKRWYIGSQFMGTATAKETLKHPRNVSKKLTMPIP